MSAKPKFAERADRLLEHSAGVDTLPEVDEHQKQAVFRAMAVGFSVYTWVLPTVAIIFFASGLWWAGLLLIISAGMPALAVRMYARQLGVGSSASDRSRATVGPTHRTRAIAPRLRPPRRPRHLPVHDWPPTV